MRPTTDGHDPRRRTRERRAATRVLPQGHAARAARPLRLGRRRRTPMSAHLDAQYERLLQRLDMQDRSSQKFQAKGVRLE